MNAANGWASAAGLLLGGWFVVQALTKLEPIDPPWVPKLFSSRPRLVSYAAVSMELVLAMTLLAVLPRTISLVLFVGGMAALTTFGALSIHHSGSCGCTGEQRSNSVVSTTIKALILRNGILALVGATVILGSTTIANLSFGTLAALSIAPWLLLAALRGFFEIVLYNERATRLVRTLRWRLMILR